MAAKDVVFCFFTAKWARPAQMLAPVIDLLKAEFDDEVQFVTLEVDDHESKEKQIEYCIVCVPTVMVWVKGNLFALVPGTMPAEHYRKLLNEAVDRAAH